MKNYYNRINKMDEALIKKIAEQVHKNSPFKNGLDGVDEDYHCHCLNCGRIVLCGPPCCDNFKSQYMVDEEAKENKNVKK